jgi:hypothetical protein
MKRTRAWSIRRQTIRRSDSQTRWDQAYQHLLQWTTTHREGVRGALTPPLQQVADAYCSLRPGLDQPTGPNADH